MQQLAVTSSLELVAEEADSGIDLCLTLLVNYLRSGHLNSYS